MSKKYIATIIASIKTSWAYIGEILYGTTFMLIIMFIFTALWKVTFAENGNLLAGLSYKETVWYLLVAESIVLSLSPVCTVMSNEVKSGELVYKLLRPVDYVLYEFFWGLGTSLTRFVVNLTTGMCLVLLLVGPIYIHWIMILFFLVALFLAFAIDYCISVLIGLSAFFTEDSTGIAFVYQKIVFVLGGVLIPLSFFPEMFQHIAKILPFAGIAYDPAAIFIGKDLATMVNIIFFQLAWLFVLSLCVVIAYRVSIKRLVINGG